MKKVKYLIFVLVLIISPVLVKAQTISIETSDELIASIGSEIILNDDIDISEIGIVITSDTTIDLNGHTITVINEYNHNIRVAEGATLIVKDSSSDESGKISTLGNMQGNGRGVIDVNGTFILESGTIEALEDYLNLGYLTNAIVVSKENKEATQGDGVVATAIINGGIIEATGCAITNHNTFGGNSEIIINDGIIKSYIQSLYTAGTVYSHDIYITGGTFLTDDYAVITKSSDMAYDEGVVPKVIVTGGEFYTSSNIIVFSIYDITEPTNEELEKYFNVSIKNASFITDQTNLEMFYEANWYTTLIGDMYVMSNVVFTTDETITSNENLIYVSNAELVNEILFNSIYLSDKLSTLINSGINISASINFEILTKDEIEDDVVNSLNEEIDDTDEVIQYFDISALLTVDGTINYIDELNEKITFMVNIDEDYLNATDSLYILRYHDGEVTKLDLSVADDSSVYFESDKFSVYALVLENEEDDSSLLEDLFDNPMTSDTVIIAVVLGTITLIGIFLIYKRITRSK